MAGHRIEKVNEEIKKELSLIIPKLKDPRIPDFVSITEVRTTPDLKSARVYFSVLGGNDEEALKGLQSSAAYARMLLSKTMKIRYTPELVFTINESIKYGIFIEQKLSELNLDNEDE